jgi:aspartate carbamoyltransferase catalytic subunit
VHVTPSDSSVAKGESLEDTIRCLACYADAVVLRHPAIGSTKQAAGAISKPLLSAGDGAGEHPTQALLDMYTMLREQPGAKSAPGKLNVTFLGDAKNGRTVHSLARLLAAYLPGRVRVRYVCPVPALRMPEYLVKELHALGLEQVRLRLAGGADCEPTRSRASTLRWTGRACAKTRTCCTSRACRRSASRRRKNTWRPRAPLW